MPATRQWLAVLGTRDQPTDGVEDYCEHLARALDAEGVRLDIVHVEWAKMGWRAALEKAISESARIRSEWLLLQYTALAWSRRGFPVGALRAITRLKRTGARVAVVFHEPRRQGGPGGVNRIRGACQDRVIARLFRHADKAIFTVPLREVEWLQGGTGKAAFIPIGANIPPSLGQRAPYSGDGTTRTVIVFGITGAPNTQREVDEIGQVVGDASRRVGPLRLLVLGRGSYDAKESLGQALAGIPVELAVRGVLPADEVSREFQRADALLFVRGGVTLRRGSALAAIANGVPIVGYRDGTSSEVLEEAGVEWSPAGDRESLVRGLVRVLSDGQRWAELHAKNRNVQETTLSWERIAKRYQAALQS